MLTENEKFAEGITDATIEAVAGEGVDDVTRVSLLQGAAIVTLLAEIADKLRSGGFKIPSLDEIFAHDFEQANRELVASSRSVSARISTPTGRETATSRRPCARPSAGWRPRA